MRRQRAGAAPLVEYNFHPASECKFNGARILYEIVSHTRNIHGLSLLHGVKA